MNVRIVNHGIHFFPALYMHTYFYTIKMRSIHSAQFFHCSILLMSCIYNSQKIEAWLLFTNDLHWSIVYYVHTMYYGLAFSYGSINIKLSRRIKALYSTTSVSHCPAKLSWEIGLAWLEISSSRFILARAFCWLELFSGSSFFWLELQKWKLLFVFIFSRFSTFHWSHVLKLIYISISHLV